MSVTSESRGALLGRLGRAPATLLSGLLRNGGLLALSPGRSRGVAHVQRSHARPCCTFVWHVARGMLDVVCHVELCTLHFVVQVVWHVALFTLHVREDTCGAASEGVRVVSNVKSHIFGCKTLQVAWLG